jgi:hypothetical protein
VRSINEERDPFFAKENLQSLDGADDSWH